MGGVHGARHESLLGGKSELRAGERADERQAFAEGASGVEIRRQRDCGSRICESPGRWHRPSEKERAGRQENADDIAVGKGVDAGRAGALEVVHRTRAELDC